MVAETAREAELLSPPDDCLYDRIEASPAQFNSQQRATSPTKARNTPVAATPANGTDNSAGIDNYDDDILTRSSPVPREDFKGRIKWIFDAMDADRGGSLQRREIIAFFGGASASMLKKLQGDEQGNVSCEAWQQFLEGVQTQRSAQVLEGFLSFCEGIIESKIELTEEELDALASSPPAPALAQVTAAADDSEQLPLQGIQLPLAQPARASRLDRADIEGRVDAVFDAVDENASGDLQKTEVIEFFGGASTTMLKRLKADPNGAVSRDAWWTFTKGVKKERGESVLEGFLSFCEEIVASKASEEQAPWAPDAPKQKERTDLDKMAMSLLTGEDELVGSSLKGDDGWSKSDKVTADADALEQKLAKQPERSRLEGRGTIKDKSTHEVQQLGYKQAQLKIKNMLETRPDRARLEERGTIKDAETHEAMLKEREDTGKVLEAKLAARPSAEELKQKGLLKDEPTDVENLAMSLLSGGEDRLVASSLKGDGAAAEENTGEPVTPSRKKISPVPRKDLDARSAWTFQMIDTDTSGDLQQKEVTDFFGGASATMLKKLKPNADGTVTVVEWNKFIKGIKKERGESVLEGFLSFCEEIISKKDSGDAADDDNANRLDSILCFDPSVLPPKEEMDERAKTVESKLEARPSADELKQKGVLKEVVEVRDDADDADRVPSYDWRARAECIFHEADLDGNGSLEREEVVAVYGGEGVVMLQRLYGDDAGMVGVSDWMEFMQFVEESKGSAARESLLNFFEEKVAAYKAEVDARAQAAEKEKAQAQALKDGLDRKLEMRPDRARLEARGTIKDPEAHEALLEERKETGRVLEEKLGARPSADQLKEKGIIKEGTTVEVDEHEDAELVGVDWRALSESVFYDLDLDHSKTVEYDEVVAVLGGSAMTILNGLMSDEAGCVGLGEWVAFLERIYRDQGVEAVHRLLEYCQTKIDEFTQAQAYAAVLKKQSGLFANFSVSPEVAANAALLEGNLERRPDRERLVERGVLKSKDEHNVQKMGRLHAQEMVQQSLEARPDRDSLEAQGLIKDLETHEQQVKEDDAATKLQAITRGNQARIAPAALTDAPTECSDKMVHEAQKKFDQMDADANGVLDGDEIHALADWVFFKFQPEGVPLSESQKDVETAKLLGRMDSNDDDEMSFEEFSLWFEQMKQSIDEYRRGQLVRKRRADKQAASKQAASEKSSDPQSSSEAHAVIESDTTPDPEATDVENLAMSLLSGGEDKLVASSLKGDGAAAEENIDEPVTPSRKKISPVPRKDLDARSAWIYQMIDADTSGDLQQKEVTDFFGGASATMLKKLKPNADGTVTVVEWNKFIKGIKKERGESVLEGFLSFCEEIISKKDSGDAADAADNNVLDGLLNRESSDAENTATNEATGSLVEPPAVASLSAKEMGSQMALIIAKIESVATMDCTAVEIKDAEEGAVRFARALRASGHAAEADDVDQMVATMHQVGAAEVEPVQEGLKLNLESVGARHLSAVDLPLVTPRAAEQLRLATRMNKFVKKYDDGVE